MIDDGLGFQLVPWTQSLEKKLGQYVSGVARDDGGIEWGFGRQRGSAFRSCPCHHDQQERQE